MSPTLTKSEEKVALFKVMENNAEHIKLQEFKELQEINEMLNLEKTYLESDYRALEKNQATLVEKFNSVVTQLEKKQETIAELKTLELKLIAEIHPLQCIKDNLEKKLSTFIDCNKAQLKRIECLEMINDELKNERDRFLEINQNNLDEIKYLQPENRTLKKELLNIEKYKSELKELNDKNCILLDDIDNLKSYNDRLKSELKNNFDLRRDELIRYQHLLAEERDKKHHMDTELLKTVKDLQLQVSKQQKCMCNKQDNKECKSLIYLYSTRIVVNITYILLNTHYS